MLERVRELRRFAAVEFATAVRELEGFPSEVALRDAWHERLSRDTTACPQGWYLPPPYGLIVAVGNPPEFSRTGQPSYRPVEAWPSSWSRLTPDSLMYVCSTRVDRTTGALGDMGCSLYRGSDDSIRAYLRAAWEATNLIARRAEIGMTFAELYGEAMVVIHRSGMTNNIHSSHHGDDTNIGHSIPWSEKPIGPTERRILAGGTAERVAELVSDGRAFISESGSRIITDGLAFTIEPRLAAPSLPTVSFHLTVGFELGKRIVIGEFEPLFEAFGMDYLAD